MRRLFFVGDPIPLRRVLSNLGDQSLTLMGIASDNPAARGLADQLNLPLWPNRDINGEAFLGHLSANPPDLIFNYNATTLFGAALLAVPKDGCVNIHPGPLPRYAGLNVHQWGIINGEKIFGVTAHMMERGIDTGDGVGEVEVPILAEDTGLTLHLKLLKAGAELVESVLCQYGRSGLPARTPQDLSARRYYGRDTPHGGRVSPTWPVHRVINFVRALSYRPMLSPTGPALFGFGPQAEIEIVKVSHCDGKGGAPGRVLSLDPFMVEFTDGCVRVEKIHIDGVVDPSEKILRRWGIDVGSHLISPGGPPI
ncbi:methionyl-tRNA formyltransferase [Magnetospira sp. QH-2]|uniref:methionyl-tRNA formyltransferase n=1 Tax=Magnetospira sp. (strain QH-2) TaxID=1288970 RepID=UPI0003E80AF6|nr:formyltransferase family protein [Magnetospira sp. QH-2]CCQ73081.1 putative Methionyl-tRNA formyltransferase [Magnetospira sp. QH-2]